jgi:hypothetical protein
VSAWQHPLERCPACGQDILLRPEVTSDARLIYVRYCLVCDAGEAVPTPRARPPWADVSIDAGSLWANTERPLQAVEVEVSAAAASPQPSPSHRPSRAGGDAPSPGGLDLWWDGPDGGRHRNADAPDSLDERWARFVAGEDEDDDDMPLAAKGAFAFGSEDIPRRRWSKLRLRQSA